MNETTGAGPSTFRLKAPPIRTAPPKVRPPEDETVRAKGLEAPTDPKVAVRVPKAMFRVPASLSRVDAKLTFPAVELIVLAAVPSKTL